ncbi:peptidyl-dipeptidase Dcp Metallo peptidase. MEROPS family M03A [Colwellia chukchiensis]|uniref:Peptidyl-dipeptidase Dcp Metallo peptidase. MEROPS family M03A n=1 Tax=Colwellia chukchiensis TaxID=641665 RepID=A0A1H7FXW5_9GAMM|nr:M3 family metallopeptidase [Colwellia chukchiensis]SEK30634.1 peptidyl-dipeptidase Dcp Metallo peptidase. MEROPS family M03A [Colwellia chukchiensis]
MKIRYLAPLAIAIALAGCQQPTTTPDVVKAAQVANNTANNPFFSDYDTPYGIPPFDKIKKSHYLPAFYHGIEQNKLEIDAITKVRSRPTFENTIVAMEKSGDFLNKVSNTFYGLTGSMSDEEMRAIAKEISPKLSALNDDIALNNALFLRVKEVYENQDKFDLRTDQKRLLETTYKSFVRGGANLNDADKQKLRELNERLSKLSLKFAENLLAETNSFEMVIDNKADLDGLPADIIAAAAVTATARGHDGKWVFTTHRPSKNPFLTYSNNRKLRETIYKGYTMRGNNDNANNNQAIASEMASLRFQKAQLLGYKTHAHFVLENATAKTPENVFGLLNKVWPAALARAKEEAADMQKMIDQQGGDFKLAAWDWWYYAEKIRKQRFDIDEAETKPYFSLEATLQGVFFTAEKLWGVTFSERDDLPKYHPDVRTFEMFDKDGSYVGIFMTDHYVRESKRGGAWMSSFRKQYRMNGEDVTPIIYNVLNYPRPVGDAPTLLTFDQASTLFHEFGHAIQGLLSNGYYRSQTGTALPRDYVEYPSQVMENWMTEPEVLANFAKHYQTGEVIPQALVEKIQASGKFNQGFATTEYLAAALLDMSWHSLETPELQDANQFEAKVIQEIGLIDEIAPRYKTGYYSHIFAGGYSAGYYGYIWSNIYDADTWLAFKENGIFDEKTAELYRKHVLESGGTDDPTIMYRRFRGQDPSVEPLLERRGLTTN